MHVTSTPFVILRPHGGWVLAAPLCALLLTSAAGCGGGGGGTPDTGAAMDAPVPPNDAPGTDAPTPTPDAPGSDASAAGGDVGLDCSTIGCGPPPICGEACDAPCGCCACGEGARMDAGGVSYVCSGGCWMAQGTGGSGDPCTSSSDCGAGLSCCYPCGVPGCTNVCEPTCSDAEPGCAGGCFLRP